MTTAPVFEHVEIGGTSLSPRMVALMENLDRRWAYEDAINAHGVVEEFTTHTIEEVGAAVAFLDDGDTLSSSTLEEFLQGMIDDYAGRATDQRAKQEVADAQRALDSAQRCFEVLSTLVRNLSEDTAYVDRVQRAIETLTPTEGEL